MPQSDFELPRPDRDANHGTLIKGAARNQPPIWEVIAEIAREIPEEELSKLPTDLAANYKHYMYGSPPSDPEMHAAAQLKSGRQCDKCRG